jgi:hypothetical protein
MPSTSVLTEVVLVPVSANVPLAPFAGAVKVMTAPGTISPFLSKIKARRCNGNASPI